MVSQTSTSFDLSLLISRQANEPYQILAYSNRSGKKVTASLPLEAIEQILPLTEQLRQNQLSLAELRDYGQLLFEALIRDQVRDMYRNLEGQNIDGLSFQLVLNLQPHELQRLPWECMYDPYREEFLSLRDNTHIIRKVERKPEGGPGKGELGYTSLVIAIANARGLPPIDRLREQDLIDEAIGDLHQSGKLKRRFIQGSSQEIRTELSAVPDVFHFVGHGGIDRNDVPGLNLEDPNGDAIFVTASELENEYFKPPPGINRRVGLVILSACQTSETPLTEGYNSLAHQLASQVDAVLAMQFPISLDNLTEFNSALYHALADGAILETAVNAARRKIISDKPRGARDWISPVLVSHQLTPFHLVSKNPFLGPTYYDTQDREQFIGRESELQQLGKLYQDQNIIVIRGASGCGKTSLLKAGLMAKLISSGQPLIYISLAEDLESRLRLNINTLLTQNQRLPLPEGDIEQLTGQFPEDLAILIDRFEQVELLGEQITRIVTALIRWADDPAQGQRRSRLVIATRLNEREEEPGLLQQQVPEAKYPRLPLKMLAYDQASRWIETVTRKSAVIFLPETTNTILLDLNYDHLEDRNMMAVQVVCREVYRRALDLGLDVARPELLREFDQFAGILEQEFEIATKLNQAFYKGGEAARKVLAQFVSSDQQSMRPRSWKMLLLRCRMEERELKQVLDLLLEDSLVRLDQQPGEDKYELVHESLVHQIDWLTEADIELRQLEEIVESAHSVIHWESEKGGLEKLNERRDDLTLTSEQQGLMLRSALEFEYDPDYWFKRVTKPEQKLSTLTSSHLSVKAQERACQFLGVLGTTEGEIAKTAQEQLLNLACADEIPEVRQAASLALAPLMDEALINTKFGAGRGDLKDGEIEALAIMFDSHWLPLKSLAASARRQVRLKLLQVNTIEIMFNAVRAACLGALGFALAVVWIYAQIYLSQAQRPPLTVLILEFALVGMLAFIMALPGALCAPLGRDTSAILSGGRRSLPAALGTIAGSALGIGLTVALLAALAEYSHPSLLRLAEYSISGAVLGGALGLPWLLSARYSLKSRWVILLVGLLGALAFYGVSTWGSWWPATSFALTLDARYGWWPRLIPGILIGLGSATGLIWGSLRTRS